MDPEKFLEILLLAANAKTDEEKARVAWRANDAMWRRVGFVPPSFARAFNNLLQNQDWPWVSDLWNLEEVHADYRKMGVNLDALIKKTRQDISTL